LSEVRASPKGERAGAVLNPNMKLQFLRLSASNSGLHPILDNFGATLKHHEAILHSHIFLIAGIDRFRARGVGPGTRYKLLGG